MRGADAPQVVPAGQLGREVAAQPGIREQGGVGGVGAQFPERGDQFVLEARGRDPQAVGDGAAAEGREASPRLMAAAAPVLREGEREQAPAVGRGGALAEDPRVAAFEHRDGRGVERVPRHRSVRRAHQHSARAEAREARPRGARRDVQGREQLDRTAGGHPPAQRPQHAAHDRAQDGGGTTGACLEVLPGTVSHASARRARRARRPSPGRSPRNWC